MDNNLLFIGMMRRANAVAIGAEASSDACRLHRAKLLVLSYDAAPNTISAAKGVSEGRVPMVQIPYSKEDIGGALGRSSCAVLAITDKGFAKSLLQKLGKAEEGEKAYDDKI